MGWAAILRPGVRQTLAPSRRVTLARMQSRRAFPQPWQAVLVCALRPCLDPGIPGCMNRKAETPSSRQQRFSTSSSLPLSLEHPTAVFGMPQENDPYAMEDDDKHTSAVRCPTTASAAPAATTWRRKRNISIFMIPCARECPTSILSAARCSPALSIAKSWRRFSAPNRRRSGRQQQPGRGTPLSGAAVSLKQATST